MKLTWRDTVATIFAILGSVVVYAKLQSYSWWLLGSWGGALGVVAVIGLAIVVLYCVDWFLNATLGVFGEMVLWILAATVTIGSLFATTTEAEFVWSSVLVGLAWLAQLCAHSWDTTHKPIHYAHVH